MESLNIQIRSVLKDRSLVLLDGNPGIARELFTSSGNWLYPLFEVEDFLEQHNIDPFDLIIVDKIIGKAAAMMIDFLGIREVHTDIISIPGKTYFDDHGITYRYNSLIEAIDCQSELFLADVDEKNQAYNILCQRADRMPKLPAWIKMTDLNISRGSTKVINHLDLCIPANTVTVMRGSNGIGKTTLTEAVMGNLEYTGTITVKPGLSRIYYLPQENIGELWPISVNEILSIEERSEERIREVCETLGISTLLFRDYRRLSGGERRRVQVALALLNEADAWILDEPFVNIDSRGQNDLVQLFSRVQREENISILIITHITPGSFPSYWNSISLDSLISGNSEQQPDDSVLWA